ncbi:hypothetical protein BKA93DRAFT_517142 [Sparassis latifolia]
MSHTYYEILTPARRLAAMLHVSSSTSAVPPGISRHPQGVPCAAQVGDCLHNRYTIMRKLGGARFSTVWLARDTLDDLDVAIKILTTECTEGATGLDEVNIMTTTNKTDPAHSGYNHVVRLLDHFRHTSSSSIHICLVLELAHSSVNNICRDSDGNVGRLQLLL